jgi:hypothetical protein
MGYFCIYVIVDFILEIKPKPVATKISAIFWVITQQVVAISYRRFGTTAKIVPKSRYEITITRCLITRKTAILIYIVAEA